MDLEFLISIIDCCLDRVVLCPVAMMKQMAKGRELWAGLGMRSVC